MAQRRGRRPSSTSLPACPGAPVSSLTAPSPAREPPGEGGTQYGSTRREGGREGGGGPGGRLATYRLLLLDPRHAAAVMEPGSGE